MSVIYRVQCLSRQLYGKDQILLPSTNIQSLFVCLLVCLRTYNSLLNFLWQYSRFLTVFSVSLQFLILMATLSLHKANVGRLFGFIFA